MKVLKSANQKNVVLNKVYYNDYSIRTMLENREICFFDDDVNECYDYLKYRHYYDKCLRIFIEKGDELKVVLDDGIYTNVLIKENGNKYYINL